ncbi:MAG: hypothetical protein RSH52_31000, partial [Janthinobacterium sp.]
MIIGDLRVAVIRAGQDRGRRPSRLPVMVYCLLRLIMPALRRRAYRAAFSSALKRLALTYTVCM